jgi:hypothetical protein
MDSRPKEEALYAARVVASNLRYLKSTWRGIIHDDTLRRSSSELRDLLLRDEFGRAWRTLGFDGEPRIHAVDLQSALKPYDLSRIGFALAGGAEFAGLKVAALRLVRVDRLETSPEPLGDPPFKDFGLRAFLGSPCLVVTEDEDGMPGEDGSRSIVRAPHWVTRRQVVSYLNHRLGGIHVSQGKTEAEKRLFALLDSAPTAFVLGKRAIYWEALSIGQAIARSDDAQRLMDAVESRTGPITEPIPAGPSPNALQRLQKLTCPSGSAHDSRVVREGDQFKLICTTCPAVWLVEPRGRRPVPVAVVPLRVR